MTFGDSHWSRATDGTSRHSMSLCPRYTAGGSPSLEPSKCFCELKILFKRLNGFHGASDQPFEPLRHQYVAVFLSICFCQKTRYEPVQIN